MSIESRYLVAFKTPSDINEHLPLLKQLASECKHVTEFGMRHADGSTLGLLAGEPKIFISWDIDRRFIDAPIVQQLKSECSGVTDFRPMLGDDLLVDIEPTEFLFIDTEHTFTQLKAELGRHGHAVSKYLAFHDTVSFGERSSDGTEPGLRAAIDWFTKENPQWVTVEDRKNNNGLLVLKRR